MAGLHVGVVVLDQDLLVRVWSPRVEDLWALRQDEVLGRSFLSLQIGLPVDLLGILRTCAQGETDSTGQVLEVVNHRGKTIQCRVSCSSPPSLDGASRSVIILVEEVVGAASRSHSTSSARGPRNAMYGGNSRC